MYKNVTTEWAETLPTGWKAVPLKRLLENGSMKVGPFGSQLSGNDFKDEGYWVYNQRVIVDENFSDNVVFVDASKYNSMRAFHVHAGDILVTARGTIGRICQIPMNYHKGIIHPCVIKFRLSEKGIPFSVLKHIFNESNIVKDQLLFLSNATTIDVIYSGTLKDIKIPVPPRNIQKKISALLDSKCSEIDTISADIQKEIETLERYKRSVITEAVTKGLNPNVEMKDSGIRWIGAIPKDWSISRLKYVAIFFNGDRGKNYPSGEDLTDDGIAFLTSNNIHGLILDCSHEKSKFITEERYNRLGGAKIQLNDIVFCLRGSVGNCAINKSLTKGTVASSLMTIRPIKASPDFINYVLQTDVCEVQTIKAMNGSCAANLSAENVSNYYFVEPPVTEQKKIAAFLDSKCSEIDTIISSKQHQLEILASYKKSLIYEYVTGQKEVI